MPIRHPWHLLLLACLIVGASACTNATGVANPSSYAAGCTNSPETGHGSGVAATENNYSIALSTSDFASGSTAFDVTNIGPSLHEFVVLRTNLPADQLPLQANGSVKTNGHGVTIAAQIRNIQPCTTKTLTVDLKAGRYVVICNLPGHYSMGMRAPLIVTNAG
jgi:uncharacterized cupredoxin-like copper-binding protein